MTHKTFKGANLAHVKREATDWIEEMTDRGYIFVRVMATHRDGVRSITAYLREPQTATGLKTEVS